MQIKMLTLFAGPAGVMAAGGTYTVDSALGEALVGGRYAVRLDKPRRETQIETQAVKPVMESTVVTIAAEKTVLQDVRVKRKR